MNTPRALRTIAVVIVLLAILDPSLTSLRRSDTVVAVVASDPERDSALAEWVALRLESRFSVVRTSFPGAAATVAVGEGLPASASTLPAPVFAVVPSARVPAVRLLRIEAPARTPLRAHAPVTADVRVVGAAGRMVKVVLRSGPLVLDQVELPVRSNDARLRAELSAIPPVTGPLPLRVEASVEDDDALAIRDLVVNVIDGRWSVLFYDPRPSWMSTFVRRSLEDDPRFEITGRIVTSTGLGTDFGSPPSGLDGPAALAGYDLIVVGAPEELTVADAASLERFLRSEGGSAVLLPDRLATGAHERLTGVSQWSTRDTEEPIALGSSAAGEADDPAPPLLRATELMWPAELPPGGRVHLSFPAAAGEAGDPGAVIWSVPVGPGRLVVSGALDAWRFRDPESSGFEEFWRGLLARAAARPGPPIEARLVRVDGVARPGSRVELEVTLPEAALDLGESGGMGGAADVVSASVQAVLSTPAEDAAAPSTPIHLWPDARAGRFRGLLRVPDGAGVHRIVVRAGELQADIPLIADPAAAGHGPDDPELVAAWIEARGGSLRSAEDLDDLAAELWSTLGADRRREQWHPMRSAWWIVPFALALGGEWWWRRRRGLA